MNIGRRYKFTTMLAWTRWEIGYLFAWSLIVTAFLQASQWNFLTIPAPILPIIGSALAIILAFKNQQCYVRFNEALALSAQLLSSSLILANKLASVVGDPDAEQTKTALKEIFYRHFAWLTALRFSLREKKLWENTCEPGNVRFLANLPTPESRSALGDELKTYLPDTELQNVMVHRGDKETLVLHQQYRAISGLQKKDLISEYMLIVLTFALDDLVRLQSALKRIKNYPYARNYYSIAVILAKMFVIIMPFGLFSQAQGLGTEGGISYWTVWLNVPFSVLVGWVFLALEKIGENSSNPFEGGANDVPISFIARKIEIEMRTILREQIDLKPIVAKDNILF